MLVVIHNDGPVTILLKIIDKVFGLRVSERDELEGLDLSQHDETAYVL